MKKRFLPVLVLLVAGCLQQGEDITRPGKLVVSSPAFPPYGTIATHYTCDGEDVNPPLMIECIPEGTTSLALIVEDKDANIDSWVHWVLFDVSPTEIIEENTSQGVVGTNSFGLQSYGGPCPLSREHTFVFQVYALDTFLNLSSDATREEITRAMEGHILAEGALEGIYCNNSRFSMDVTPLKVRVKRGESAKFQIHTTFCNPAFSHIPISFLIRGLHSSMGWHMTPDNALVVDSSPETPPGIYWLKIIGDAQGCSITSYTAFIVEGETQDQKDAALKEAVLPELQDIVSDENWTQFGGNAQHTSYSSVDIPATLEILWNYKVSPPGAHRHLCPQTAPALVDDKVYILDLYSLTCISLETGSPLYRVPECSLYPYTPSVSDGRVFLSGTEEIFQCRNAYTGRVLWEREFPGLYLESRFVDDMCIYATADHLSVVFCMIDPCRPMGSVWTLLIALNKETGEEVWRYSAKDWSPLAEGLGIPTGADGSVFIFVNDYYDEKSYYPDQKKSGILCLDAYTGAVKWKCENMIPILFDAKGSYPFWMTYYEQRLYIDMEDRVLCVDTETQEPVWDYVWNDDINPVWRSISVGSGVVVVHRRLQVECLDAETGEVLWAKPLKGKGIPVITKSEVFVCGEGTLYRMDIRTGKISGYYTVGEPIYSVVVAQNRVLVGTEKDRIYCLGEPGHSMTILAVVLVLSVFIVVLVLISRAEYC